MNFRGPARRILLFTLLALLVGPQVVPRVHGDLKAPLWVEADNEHLATLVPPDRIQAWLGDDPAQVRAVHPADGNLILLIVMDVVGDLIRVDAARQGLVEILNRFGPREFAGVLRAQDGLQVLLEPTSDRESLRDALLSLPVSGFPGLLESVEDAATLADRMLIQSDVRIAVLYITDGSIYAYRGDYTNPVINPSDGGDLSRRFRDRLIQERITSLLDSLMASSAPLFFLHLERERDSLNSVYQNGITQFAQATGGEALFCESVAQIRPYLEQIVQRVKNQQVVTLVPPDGVEGRVRLRLEVEGAKIDYREQFNVARRPAGDKSK